MFGSIIIHTCFIQRGVGPYCFSCAKIHGDTFIRKLSEKNAYCFGYGGRDQRNNAKDTGNVSIGNKRITGSVSELKNKNHGEVCSV